METKLTGEIMIDSALNRSLDYEAYKALVDELLLQGRSTGKVQSEAMNHYSMLNQRRMRRLDKTFKLGEDDLDRLSSLSVPMTMLVISEGWCGDAAHALPVLNKIAQASDQLKLRIVFRDEEERLMDRFLTKGARSIPKVILLDRENQVMGEWGPRPSVATAMVDKEKLLKGVLSPDFKKDLQLWYNKDKGVNIKNDILDLLSLEQVGN
ncbi:thioredoxin family protein [Robertkochia aurantiaca]|uniref:thioredoxin family protein n=1 Tax=Robertkochia aurantiaca TaxID=2873700 RepID=UPI001CCC2ACA|nr:thioredoxin family protein [Robertkochia sp. 3YJGBD-33]